MKRLADWLKPTAIPTSEEAKQLPATEQAFRDLLAETISRGDHEAAIALLTQAIAQWPHAAEWYYNRGVAASELKRYEAALTDYEAALQRQPENIATLNNHGICLSKLGRHAQALESYDRAIALNPDYAQALNNRGYALGELKRYGASLESFERAIALQPHYAEALQGAGIAMGKLKQHAQALGYFDRALAAKPHYAEAWNGRGIALGELKRHAQALDAYDHALAIEPNYVEALNNRGNTLGALGRIDEARAGYDRAIALNPHYANAYRNRGILNLDALELDEALADFETAIAYEGAEAPTLLDKSLVLLLCGDYVYGWQCYEGRQYHDIYRNFPQTLWRNDFSLAGKTILLHCEQGIGDTIQFCRYIPLVKALGARIILEVQRPLIKMLHQLEGVSVLIPRGEALPHFDCHCPLMSLPFAFKTTLETIPSPRGYLTAKPHKSESWMGRLGYPKAPHIGICWSGNPDHNRDRDRSIPLAHMMEFLPRDFHYIALQKNMGEADHAAQQNYRNLQFTGQWIHDFTDTAALIAAMDIVITVDTSVAHLAGALGKPVWLLVSHRPDFRWLLDRADSPWYASVKIYRQQARGEWEAPLSQLKADLSAYFAALQRI